MAESIHIAIASGKGGTGKTFVATNLFHTLHKSGSKVTLIDCDAEEPNALLFFAAEQTSSVEVTQRVPVIDASKCTYCGRCHEYCHYNAIFILPPARYIQVIEDLCHGCGACLVACNDNAITEKEVPLGQVTHFRIAENAKLTEARMKTGVFSPVSVIKAAIREANGTDLVIMDAPPGTSCPFIQTVDKADFVVLVTEPTPFGLSDLQQSVQTLRHMNKSMGVIINRAGLGNDAVHEWLQQEGLPLLLEIPFDKQIAAAYSNGRLIAQEQPEMEEAFAALFYTILEHHGNSHHQR